MINSGLIIYYQSLCSWHFWSSLVLILQPHTPTSSHLHVFPSSFIITPHLPGLFSPSQLPSLKASRPSRLVHIFSYPSQFLCRSPSQPHSLIASSFFLCSRHFEIPPVYRSDPHPIVYYNMCQAISTCPLFSFCKK